MAASWLSRMDDPEVQRLTALQQKAQVNRRYAALFKSLKLTPEQLAQFKNLLVEKQTANTDALIAASQQGINPLQNPEEFRQLVASAQAEIDTKIKTTLGDDGYEQFQSYNSRRHSAMQSAAR